MPMTVTYYVYLLTNWNNKVMYLGVTNNLERRLYEHKNKLVKGFTEKYRVNRNWCGKSSFFCQLFVVLQIVMPILNIDIFLLFIPLLNR